MGYIYGRYYCENNVSMTCEYVLPPYTLRRSVNIFANVNPTYQINPSLRLSSLIAINIYSVWLFYFYRNNILFIEFWWLLFFSPAWYTISTFRYSDWYSLNFLIFTKFFALRDRVERVKCIRSPWDLYINIAIPGPGWGTGVNFCSLK